MEDQVDLRIKKLIRDLSSRDDLIRTRARGILQGIGERAIPFLAGALDDPDDIERWEAAEALVNIGGPTAAPILVRALENEEFEVRWLAAKGLIEMGFEGLRPLLRALTDHAGSVTLREGAHRVLEELAKGDLRQALIPLLTAMHGNVPEAEVPIKALEALESVEDLERTAQKTDRTIAGQVTIERIEFDADVQTHTAPHTSVRRYVRALRAAAHEPGLR